MRTCVPDERRRLIIDAASRLLVSRGFQDIVLDDVAREAGVAKGTLFLYYRSKDQLFASAFASLVDQLGEALDAVERSGRTGKPLLAETVRIVLRHIDRNRDFLSQFGVGRFPSCGAKSNGMLKDKFQQNINRVVSILARCADAGAIRLQKDVKYQAVALLGLCRSVLVAQTMAGGKHSAEAEIDKVLDLFLNGAAPKG